MNDSITPTLASLPFVSPLPDSGFNFWDVKTTGNYNEDLALGNEYARRYIGYLISGEYFANALLGWIMRDMSNTPDDAEGVVIGFADGITKHLRGAE